MFKYRKKKTLQGTYDCMFLMGKSRFIYEQHMAEKSGAATSKFVQ